MSNVVIRMLVEDFATGRIILMEEASKDNDVHLPEIRMPGICADDVTCNFTSIYALANDVLLETCGDIMYYDSWTYVGKIVYSNYTCIVLHRFADLVYEDLLDDENSPDRAVISPSIYDITFECFNNGVIKDPILLYKQFMQHHCI